MTEENKDFNTVFFHSDKMLGKRFTAAFNIPKAINLQKFIDEFKFVPEDATNYCITMGVAFCHPKDQYCRAKGRQVALDKMQKLEMKVDSISIVYRNDSRPPVEIHCSTKLPTGEEVRFDITLGKKFAGVSFVRIIH